MTTTRPDSFPGPSTRRWSRRFAGSAPTGSGATDAVVEALAPACLEQVVTGKEAFRAFRLLTLEFGEPAPGPTDDPTSAAYGMRLPPTAGGVVADSELEVPGRRG